MQVNQKWKPWKQICMSKFRRYQFFSLQVCLFLGVGCLLWFQWFHSHVPFRRYGVSRFDLGSGPKTSPSQLAIHCFERRERLRGKALLCCCHVLKAKNSSIIKKDIRSHILRKMNFTKYKPVQKKSSHFKLKRSLIEKPLLYEQHPKRKVYQRQRIVELNKSREKQSQRIAESKNNKRAKE